MIAVLDVEKIGDMAERLRRMGRVGVDERARSADLLPLRVIMAPISLVHCLGSG